VDNSRHHGGIVTSDFDIAILGAGISGLGFAHHAARAGLQCLVLEQAPEPGGCIHTVRAPAGFWFELGAHTLYNSYGALLDIIEAIGVKDRIQKRAKAPYRLWVDGKIRTVPSQLAMGELFASAWRAFTERKAGRTVEEYYGRLVGKGNWKRVFAPLLSAVPSQRADAFPAEMLFKRRPRRKHFPRTFTFQSGLGYLIDRLPRDQHITLRTNAEVRAIAREGALFAIQTTDGDRALVRKLVLALPPAVGARLLAPVAAEAAHALAGIAVAEVMSTGVVLEKHALDFPRMTGLVPLEDAFFSVVTRDVVEDERFRALAFHFRAGLSLDERLDRIARVTGAPRASFVHVAEHASSLPSPGRGHADIVAALDTAIADGGIYVTGNFFGGLAIEDCVLRSRAECERLLRDLQRE
jgi:protoporphyrinogen/coproporphyrinogen III oxidase